MDTLPAEILAQIVDSLPWEKAFPWGHYSPISRAWKAAIERLTFRRLTIRTNDLNTFAALFTGENISRRAYVEVLIILFMLPILPNATGCCPVDQPPDREADSIAFSTSVAKLFTILGDLQARATETQPVTLSFQTGYRLTEPDGSEVTKWKQCRDPFDMQITHYRREIREARALSGQFELLRGTIVPILHGITTFEFRGNYDLSDLKPTSFPGIVARLPDLERLFLCTNDNYDSGRRIRIANRECFATSIRNLDINHLRELRLEIERDPMGNESLPVHELVNVSKWDQEPWSCMLSHLASLPNLAVLRLLGGLVICPEFFRSIVDHPDIPFPSLVDFEMQFAAETADGRWFYQRDDKTIAKSRTDPKYEYFWEQHALERANEMPSYAWSDFSDDYVRVLEDEPIRTDIVSYDQFRSLPDATTLLPFLMDASKAALRIPNLKKFILKLGDHAAKNVDLDYFPVVSRVFELWYLKAGMHRSRPNEPSMFHDPIIPGDAAYLHQNRLYWRVDREKPWDEVQATWSAIAGPDAKIVFLEEDLWKMRQHDNPIYTGEF